MLRQETTLLAVIVAVGIVATLRNPAFLNPANLTDIARAAVIYFVMGCGASLLMIGGGLDFSVGAVFTLGGIICAWLLVWGAPWPLAVLAGVAA
ncbi:MAG: ABC transporter permease, partial [Mesorhizobium sp.]